MPREICVSKSASLILGGKFTSQNRLGYIIVQIAGRKFVSNLQKVLTETRLEDVHISKTQPFKCFACMDLATSEE